MSEGIRGFESLLLRCAVALLIEMPDDLTTLPASVSALVKALARARGVEAVVLGGSRAAGTADAKSDWDLGVYYRGALDLEPLGRWGTVHPPGSWGRIMNGGAWLTIDAMKVDVLLRDLDVVEAWSEEARHGRYEVDALLGYTAGAPTYMLLGERALGRPLAGSIAPAGPFPEALATRAEERWKFHARFSLAHARMRAERGDIAGAVGCAAKAVLEEGQAILAARREWVLNEKRLIERAGLAELQRCFRRVPGEVDALMAWTEDLERALAGGGGL